MMKHFTLIIGTTLWCTALFAGNPSPETLVGTDTPTQNTIKNLRTLKSVAGTLSTELKLTATNHHQYSLSTEVTLTFPLDCNQKFEKFSYVLKENESENAAILTNAFVSEGIDETSLDCPNIHTETITLPGDVSGIEQTPIFTHPFTETSFAIPPGTQALVGFNDAVVTEVAPLCPQKDGIRCFTDGTIISLTTNLICVNSIAGITYTAEQIGDEIHVNLFGAVHQNKFHDKVKCKEMPVSFSITAIMAFADSIEKVKINVVP